MDRYLSDIKNFLDVTRYLYLHLFWTWFGRTNLKLSDKRILLLEYLRPNKSCFILVNLNSEIHNTFLQGGSDAWSCVAPHYYTSHSYLMVRILVTCRSNSLLHHIHARWIHHFLISDIHNIFLREIRFTTNCMTR